MLGLTSRGTDYTQARVGKGSWSQQGEHQHGVQFYSQDEFLLEELSEYVGNALRAGDAAVVVATEQHCDGLLPGLMAQGLDIAALLDAGRFGFHGRSAGPCYIHVGWVAERRAIQGCGRWDCGESCGLC